MSENSRVTSTTRTEIEIDDEDYEEMVEQLEAFKLSSKCEMCLPTGINIADQSRGGELRTGILGKFLLALPDIK